MRSTDTRTIDGFSYDVTQLPGMRGVRFLARLGRIVGPSLGGLITSLQGGGLAGADLSAVAVSVGRLFIDLTENELEAICRELLGSATYRDPVTQKIVPVMDDFDLHFQGRAASVLKLLAFALEVNYGNFFDALRGAVTAQGAAKP